MSDDFGDSFNEKRKCVPSCGDNTGDQNDKRTAVTMLGTEEFWEFLRKKFDDDFNGE